MTATAAPTVGPRQPRRARIETMQDDPDSRRLFLAFSAYYRDARRWREVRFWIDIAFGLAGPIASVFSLWAANIIGSCAAAWIVISRTIVIPTEERRRHEAVRFHERFDTRLFNLPWPEGILGPEPAEEDISNAANRLAKIAKLNSQYTARCKDWYPTTGSLPWPVDVAHVQWSGIAYGRHLNRRYTNFLKVLVVVLALGLVAFGVTFDMSFVGLAGGVITPALPAALDLAELIQKHTAHAHLREEIERRQLRPLLAAERQSKGSVTDATCREVQDRCASLRLAGLSVPDWFYRLQRDDLETITNDGAGHRLVDWGY